MKPQILKAEASWHSVILMYARRAARVNLRQKAETATSDLGRKSQKSWQPLCVLPQSLVLKKPEPGLANRPVTLRFGVVA